MGPDFQKRPREDAIPTWEAGARERDSDAGSSDGEDLEGAEAGDELSELLLQLH